MDGEPARGAVTLVTECVGYAGRDGNETAGGDRDRLGLAPDLEGQFALEDVKGIRVLVVSVRAGYSFTRCVPRVAKLRRPGSSRARKRSPPQLLRRRRSRASAVHRAIELDREDALLWHRRRRWEPRELLVRSRER